MNVIRRSTRASYGRVSWNTTSRSTAPTNRPRQGSWSAALASIASSWITSAKGEYQRWLHARDKDHDDCDGRPDRTPDEIREWAHEHQLPYVDDEVHFPDARIEFEEPDGRWGREDIEVTTAHYRGAHGERVARTGFSRYRGVTLCLSGEAAAAATALAGWPRSCGYDARGAHPGRHRVRVHRAPGVVWILDSL